MAERLSFLRRCLRNLFYIPPSSSDAVDYGDTLRAIFRDEDSEVADRPTEENYEHLIDQICGICFQRYGPGELIAVPRCGHIYHGLCARECQNKRPSYPCPMDRGIIISAEVDVLALPCNWYCIEDSEEDEDPPIFGREAPDFPLYFMEQDDTVDEEIEGIRCAQIVAWIQQLSDTQGLEDDREGNICAQIVTWLQGLYGDQEEAGQD